MTEIEWLTCTVPDAMLKHLGRLVSDRKLRLYSIACFRNNPGHLMDQGALDEIEEVRSRIEPQTSERAFGDDGHSFSMTLTADGSFSLTGSASGDCGVLDSPDDRPHNSSLLECETGACDLLREVFGNPFLPVIVDSAWLRSGCQVRRLAEAIHESESFHEMPVLGAALEQAGCTEESILAHCQARTDHVRGCWVVDLMMGYFW